MSRLKCRSDGQLRTTSQKRGWWRTWKRPSLAVFASVVVAALVSAARGQPSAPHIGYVYPAGGQRGTSFQATIGGQFLDGASNVVISGTGIQAVVIDFTKPMPQGEFNRLRDRLRELQDKRQAAFRGVRQRSPGAAISTNSWTAVDEKEFADIRQKILKNPPNRQATAAIAENVIVRMTLAAQANRGEREIRLATPQGLSNPLKFCVDQLPEFSQPPAKAPNPDLDRFLERLGGQSIKSSTQLETRITLPSVVNGQISPGGVDRYRFHALKGQSLVVIVSARDLIPYLADAVPGWFQATLALYDAKGKELAYDDDYRFHPDPLLHYLIPSEGDYVVEIKDALYRGREDFVYRVALGEFPFVTSIFPMGGRAGETTQVELSGWNLPTNLVAHTNDTPGISSLRSAQQDRVFNQVPFAVDTLPECFEKEPNDSPATAQLLALPVIVNGRSDRPGDRDVFRFEGRAGEDIVAEVDARRLDSPMDSLLELTDANGNQLGLNDDCEDKGRGLSTHHADSYLRATLPSDGVYYIDLRDTQHKGGREYGYRLRLGSPRPDFELRVVPSSLTARPGISVPITVYALRRDGFTNEIRLRLKKPPDGISLSGGVVPPERDQIRMTLGVPTEAVRAPLALELEGRATLCGKEIIRQAVAADDVMQAFAYRHLVPAKELRVAMPGRALPRPIKVLSESPVQIPIGGDAVVKLAGPAGPGRFQFELSEPPTGIKLGKVSWMDRGAELVLRCDPGTTNAGLKGNLIVSLIAGNAPGAAGKTKRPGGQRRAIVGVLPAIPFEITGPKVTYTAPGAQR